MQFTTSILTLLCAITLAHALPKQGSGDYYTLGCPSTTKPWANHHEQLEAVTSYYTELFSGQINTAFDTWAAKKFINHSPEVKGDGTAVAKAAVSGLLATSKEELLNIFVGKSANGTSYASVYFKGINPRGVGAILEVSLLHLIAFPLLISI